MGSVFFRKLSSEWSEPTYESIWIQQRQESEVAGHFRNFKRGELERFFNQHGFKTVKVFYAGFPFYSPITRDLLSLAGGSPGLSGKELSFWEKQSSLLIYYLYRYFSTVNWGGDQFMGLFEKVTE